MNHLWKTLPNDIIGHIISYDNCLKYRNGKLMDQIPDPDKNYKLLLDRMRFNRTRRYMTTLSFATIDIPNTNKQLGFIACNKGVNVSFYDPIKDDCIRIYSNRNID